MCIGLEVRDVDLHLTFGPQKQSFAAKRILPRSNFAGRKRDQKAIRAIFKLVDPARASRLTPSADTSPFSHR